MNAVERLVYRHLRDHPKLKRRVRDAYQLIFEVLPSSESKCPYPVTVREGHFFGFHDKTPFSTGDRYLLTHKAEFDLRMPKCGDRVEVGYFEGTGWNTYHPLSDTSAWNWHQGAMLQWLGNSDCLIFNDHAAGKDIARVVDLEGRIRKVLSRPIGAVSRDGRFALGYDFVRSNRGMPGYGYANGGDGDSCSLAGGESELWLIDLQTGSVRSLLTLKDIMEQFPDEAMEDCFQWFTHCQFSPSGDRFVFFHRWVNERTRERWTRMFSCDSAGRLWLFPTRRMVSHMCWRDEASVIAYARTAEHDDRYYEFCDGIAGGEVVGQDVFRSDGHPSVRCQGDWMVTDTYPDARRLQRLMLYDLRKRILYEIGQFRLPRCFTGSGESDHWTVDLHPRWSRGGEVVCFDGGFSGRRSLCTVRVGDLGSSTPLHLSKAISLA